MENIQENFFSKNNIEILNKKLLEQLNAINANGKDKQYIVNTLLKNMKTTWMKIDSAKINRNNFQSIFTQFNNLSFKNTYLELNELINKKKTQDPSILKFERDFKSNPNNGVTFMERSQSVMDDNNSLLRNNSVLGPNENYILKNQQVQKTANNFDSGLDNLFRPLINDPPNEPSFNNYQIKKHSADDFQSRLSEIQSSRNQEVPTINKGDREIPDFLKSKNTNVRQDDQTQNKSTNKKPDIEFLDDVNHYDNLYSLDNIDKLLINDDIEEDTAPFAERLKKLENERNNIKMPKQSTIDFQSETFKDNFDSLKNYEPTLINQQDNHHALNKYQEQNELNKFQEMQKQQELNKYQEMQKQNELNKYQEMQKQNELNKYQEMQKQNELNKYQEMQKQQELNKYQEMQKQQEKKKLFENYLKEKELEKNELSNNSQSKTATTHKEIFDQLKKLNKNLLNQVSILKKELEDIKLDKTTKFDQIKEEISEEFNKLQEDKQYNDNKIKEIEQLNLLTTNKLNELKIKENELLIRETEFNKLYSQYSVLLKNKKYQIEISPDNSISSYRFNLSNQINITGIKLLNYSIPNKKYNIEENINNIFSYMIDNKTYNLNLSTGFYTIELLIEKLNENENIKFKLDIFTQKIQIDSENVLKLINTNLSIMLGFKNYESYSSHILADVIYDLRIDNKVYLYINNIVSKPFAILNPNNTTTESEFLFEESTQIDFFDIIFKDSKGNNINFYDINHYLNLEVTVVE